MIQKILYMTSALTLAAITTVAMAQDNQAEIEYLLTTVGGSNCVFVRNGSRHSAESAESHLRMKYGKTRRYIKDAEAFITRLASESSWTGKPYTLECPDEAAQPSKDWLFLQLAEYRAANREPAHTNSGSQ